MKTILSILIIAITLVTTGCNLLVKVPVGGPALIPTETFSLDEDKPPGAFITTANLTLAPSNGTLKLAGGAQGLVNGAIQYNVAIWKPTLVIEDTKLSVEQAVSNNALSSMPKDSVNQWELTLGDALKHINVFAPSGSYTLNFADTLPDGASIYINAGVGDQRLVFPAGVTVSVEVHRGPASITTEGLWATSGKIYTSGNSDSAWTVKVDIGVGNLTLAVE